METAREGNNLKYIVERILTSMEVCIRKLYVDYYYY